MDSQMQMLVLSSLRRTEDVIPKVESQYVDYDCESTQSAKSEMITIYSQNIEPSISQLHHAATVAYVYYRGHEISTVDTSLLVYCSLVESSILSYHVLVLLLATQNHLLHVRYELITVKVHFLKRRKP